MTLFGFALYDVLQALVIAIILAMSVLHVTRKLAPNWTYGRQTALAEILSLPSRSNLSRRLGKFILPTTTSGGGCGSGCNTCGSCESNPEKDAGKKAETQPLKFTRHI